MSQNEFFISHATADRELVSEFVDFMEVALKVDRSKIYCTSGIGTKTIRTGTNFIEDIKKNVIGTKVVIFILTPNYFKSNFCLAELGAAWALNSDIYPILIPPTPIEVLKSTPLSESSQVITLNTLDDIVGIADEFIDMKVAKYGGAKLLNTRANRLLDWIKENCSFETNDMISKAEYLSLQSELESLKESISQKNMELVSLQSEREAPLKLERARITEHIYMEEEEETISSWDSFNQFVRIVRKSLSELDDIVISAIYFDEFHRGEAKFWPVQNDFINWNTVTELTAKKLIYIDQDDCQITPNYEEYLVEEAVNLLHALSRCISSDIDSEMKREFARNHKFNLDFKSKMFWEEILNVTIYV
ncbi:toll/interleukin-1 receptor domain-containing protein [Bacillus cereus]|uniref:toll/interleukin-1 receptor domain-containing protein n=1 Tax=Bacillus cereus TaxID=1396 RepID=UPI0018D14961|nr:toll/interleukin-1 receptor domain-containing protein [Bacillus cereus]MBH0323399.1 toll/interleukin-1 receptor domain-containing protein [Bacillus cereus]